MNKGHVTMKTIGSRGPWPSAGKKKAGAVGEKCHSQWAQESGVPMWTQIAGAAREVACDGTSGEKKNTTGPKGRTRAGANFFGLD